MKKYQINNFEENLYYEELNNGLKIYTVPIKNKKQFSVMLITRYGGRDINFEKDGKVYNTPTGIAHFLEHKMFEREDDPFSFYGKFGSDVNAATSDDYTCYYFIGNKGLEEGLKYLLNWIQSLNITDEQVEKEQGIILEEASMYKDNPNRVLYNEIRKNIYVNDSKKNQVIGTDDDIVRITKKDLDLCYNTFYVPSNMYLIVTGNVDPERIIEIAKHENKSFNRNNINVKSIYNNEPDTVACEFSEKKMNVEIPKVAVAYKINKDIFNGLNITAFELDVYLHCLINISLGITSEIRQKWLENKLFNDAFYRISEIESHYIIEFYATSNKEDELIKALEEYLEDLQIDEESFEREKKLWIANEIRSIDNPMTVLYGILDDLLDYGNYISNKIEYIKHLNYKTLEKIKKIISYNNKTTVKITPKKEKAEK